MAVAAAAVPEVTCLYAGGLGLLAAFLSMRTARARRATIFTKHGDLDLLEAYNKVVSLHDCAVYLSFHPAGWGA